MSCVTSKSETTATSPSKWISRYTYTDRERTVVLSLKRSNVNAKAMLQLQNCRWEHGLALVCGRRVWLQCVPSQSCAELNRCTWVFPAAWRPIQNTWIGVHWFLRMVFHGYSSSAQEQWPVQKITACSPDWAFSGFSATFQWIFTNYGVLVWGIFLFILLCDVCFFTLSHSKHTAIEKHIYKCNQASKLLCSGKAIFPLSTASLIHWQGPCLYCLVLA